MTKDTERDPKPFRLRKLEVKGVKVAPDWREWKLIPKAEVRQACLLSLNLNPYRIHENAWPADAEDYYDEFFLRQRVLQANLKSDPARFSGNRYHTHVVLLSELAAWALSVDWDIPPELAALAKKPGAQTITPENVQQRDSGDKTVSPKGSDGGAAGTISDPPPDTANWILLVQVEAARRWIALRQSGASPTKHSIKDDLVKWCATKNIKTVTGIAVSSENLYKHALRPWTPPADSERSESSESET